jgi:carbamoyltransferase
MIVLGISGALNHDAAVSVICDGKILFASHSERYSKIKNDPNLNAEIIQEALSYGKPDVIAWYEKPLIKKWRQLIAGQYSLAFDLKELPGNYLKNFEQLKDIPIVYQSHHYTHAASGYFTSPFNDAAIAVIDSIGELETLSIWRGKNDNLVQYYSQAYPASVGLFYSAMTDRLGLKPQEDEYILMGMAAYGDINREVNNKTIIQHMYDEFGIVLNDHSSKLYHVVNLKKNLHRGCKDFLPELITEQDHYDIAAATQEIYTQMLSVIIDDIKKTTFSTNLVLMGGCALNCSANSLITERFKNVWIMPNPGDAGSCIGASQKFFDTRIKWETPYLGHNIEGSYPVEKALNALLNGDIIGIANGRAEFGPRALGNRTLTADPRGDTIKDRMNEIKRRQKFRPFAPMILEEDVHDYFIMPENINSSPYMQFVAKCKYPLDFPAIIHADGTSRVQTVNKQQHPELYTLLSKFKEKTGCPMLVNTSLNIKGQPIVNDLNDAQEFSKHYDIKVFTSDD